MKNLKLLLVFVLLTIALSTSAFSSADTKTCYINETCYFISDIFNTTEMYYDANNATTSFYAQDGTTLINDASMTKIGTGKFVYSYNFTENNTFLRETHFDNKYYGTEEVDVRKYHSKETQEEISMLDQTFLSFFIFLIGAILLSLSYFGETKSSYFFGLAAGVWWLANATVIIFSGVTLTSLFYMLLGVVAIFISIGEMIKDKGD